MITQPTAGRFGGKGRLRSAGVTGTNGKTTTATWLAAALGAVGCPAARATTLGFFVGDEALPFPRTYDGFVRAMNAGAERGASFAAVEATSEALAAGFAQKWPCEVGIFTNLTHDHLDAHKDFEHYLASKAQLFAHLPAGGTAVLNGCDETAALLEEVLPDGVHVLRYGVPSRGQPYAPLDLTADRVDLDWTGTRILVTSSGRCAAPRELIVRAHGEVFAENALAALAGAVALGVPAEVAATAIASTAAPPGRFEVITERPWAIVDYAHSPDALARTCLTARRLCPGKLTVVFGAGGHRDRTKRAAMGAAAAVADDVILTSDNPRGESAADIARDIRAGLAGHPRVTVELDRSKAIRRALAGASPEDVVLVAGKGHEAEQLLPTGAVAFSDRDELLAARRR